MNIVVIGLGSMGKRRIRLIKAIYPQYDIIGVDSNIERVQAVEKEYQIFCFKSIQEAKEQRKIQCAFVCTAPLSHAAIITECLMSDWDVFTEINLVSDQYETNIQLAKDRKKILFLSSTPIYRAEMQKIDCVIAENNKPVNYLYHVGQYLPDWHPWEKFNEFFVENKRTNGCREILAIELPWMIRTFGTITGIQVIKSQLTSLKIDYPDSYLIQLQHASGTSGTFAVDVVCRQAVRHLEIYNENLYLEWNGTPESLQFKNTETNRMELLDSVADYKREDGYSAFVNEYAYINEIKEFFAVLNREKEVQYDFTDDLKTLEIIDQIEFM